MSALLPGNLRMDLSIDMRKEAGYLRSREAQDPFLSTASTRITDGGLSLSASRSNHTLSLEFAFARHDTRASRPKAITCIQGNRYKRAIGCIHGNKYKRLTNTCYASTLLLNYRQESGSFSARYIPKPKLNSPI